MLVNVRHLCVSLQSFTAVRVVSKSVGQTNACSVVFRGKQHVREFEIRPRSSSSSVEATGDSQRVKTYGLVNIVYIFID